MSASGLFPLSEHQKFAWLRLIRSENVGPRTFRGLVNKFGSAEAALEALPDLTRQSGRTIRIADEDAIVKEIEESQKLGVQFLGLGEQEYPALLRQIDSPPPLIAVRGNLNSLSRPKIAIVGSRNASAVGLTFTERLARAFAAAGYCVVSGLARGIDHRAHQTCLRSGTIAVLAGGHKRIYPSEHQKMAEEITHEGALISEMPLHWEPRGRDFPRRNRLVSGLSRATVVVEAARHSGSLITAKFALEQNRDVFAVPGSPLDPRAEGTNDLLRQGAILCTSPDDVLEIMALGKPPQLDLFKEVVRSGPSTEPLWDEFDPILAELYPQATLPRTIERMELDETPDNHFTHDQRDPLDRILQLLGPSPCEIDELARLSGISAQNLRQILFDLELQGRLERHGANLVSLTVP